MSDSVRQLRDTEILRRMAGRTGFGATAAEADGARERLTPEAEKLARAEKLPRPPRFESLERPPKGADRRAYRKALRERGQRLIWWWLDRMVAAENPWPEKRTLLWHGFWATSMQKVRRPELMVRQHQTLRDLGGGDFRTLARAMVRDPALMIWLDAAGSTAKAPNENLARELMELFTLGVGNYAEDDVKQAALALTGWVINRREGGDPVFVPRRHAPGTHTVLGTTADLSDQGLVDLLVARPESAAHVAARLWGWLVSSSPPSPAALRRLTEAYGSARDLSALFEALLTGPEFAEPGNVLIKQPVEWLVGGLRALGLRPSRLPDRARKRMLGGLQAMGQVPFRPPNVSGWPSGSAWLTTSAMRARIGLAQLLARHTEDNSVDRLGVPDWTPRTRSAFRGAAGPRQRLVLALCSPEYAVNP